MEPKYENNSIVWVKKQLILESGEIRVFILNNESICRKLHYENGKCYLVSLNDPTIDMKTYIHVDVEQLKNAIEEIEIC
jgi:phage repressor protein C with HTH and peptisase S24 domain